MKNKTFPTIAAVIASADILWGQTVEVKDDGHGNAGSYTKVPQDDDAAKFGAIFEGVDSDGNPATYTKNAEVMPGHVLLTGGRPGITAQDAANAAANAERLGWPAAVTPDTGAILLGNTEKHARAFRVRGQEDAGWCYFKGFAGIGRDIISGAPFLRLEMLDPRGRKSPKVDDQGRRLGTLKKSRTFTVGIVNLTPDQHVEGCSALLNPDGEAAATTGARNDRAMAKEARRRAARSGKSEEAATGSVQPFAAVQREDGSFWVEFNAAAGAVAQGFAAEPHKSMNDAETRARILNGRAASA